MLFSRLPGPQGLYDPDLEVDSCGVAMVADVRGRRSHSIVSDGLLALENLEHRGAAGSEPNSGDCAGILLQLPTEFCGDVIEFDLPAPADDGTSTYAARICFLPRGAQARAVAQQRVLDLAADEGMEILGWREIPVDPAGAGVGAGARACEPHMIDIPPDLKDRACAEESLGQVFVAAPAIGGIPPGGLVLDRLVYPLRKRAERIAPEVEADGAGMYFAVEPDPRLQGNAYHIPTFTILSGSA